VSDTAFDAFDIIWEGAGLLALNKKAGVQVHGRAKGQNSVDEQVRSYLAGKLPESLSFKSGPLHRLDKPASGILVFSTSLEGARVFSALLRARRLRKRYLALADGTVEGPELWEEMLVRDTGRKKTLVAEKTEAGNGRIAGAKAAKTRVFPLAVKGNYSLILLEIETGRTHQIRAQAAFHGHPLAGDRKYGGSSLAGGLLLHALSLEFPPKPEENFPESAGPAWDALWGTKLQADVPGAFLTQIRRIFGKSAEHFFR
jgi:23S rRNA pseudouridine955/2504/2580 synthase